MEEVNYLDDDGTPMIKGFLITEDVADMDELKTINDVAQNQIVTYRHDHPAKPVGGHVLGRVLKTDIRDRGDGKQGVYFEAKLKDYTDYHKKVIEYLKREDREPVKMSASFMPYNRGNSKVAEPYAFALTGIPYDKHMPEVQRMNFEDMTTEEIKEELDSVTKANKKLEAVNKELRESLTEFEAKQEDKFGQLVKEMQGIRKELEDERKRKKELEKEIAQAKIEDEKGPILADLKKQYSEQTVEIVFKPMELEKLKKFHEEEYEEPKEKSDKVIQVQGLSESKQENEADVEKTKMAVRQNADDAIKIYGGKK